MPGEPSFLNVFGICTYVSWCRNEPNHHNLSLMIAPPADPLKSFRCCTRAPVVNPRVRRSSSRFVDCRCQLSDEPPKKPDPCSVLPPSFGIRLSRTPPADDSADTPLVW